MVEVIPGLFGFLGLGWIYSGCTRRGLWILGGVLLWNLFEAGLVAATAGVACCFTLPLNIIMVATSASFLNMHIDQNPGEFSAQ